MNSRLADMIGLFFQGNVVGLGWLFVWFVYVVLERRDDEEEEGEDEDEVVVVLVVMIGRPTRHVINSSTSS
jgi:hypothetical protein